MIAFLIYGCLLLYVIYRYWPADKFNLKRSTWTGLFLLKILAIPAFYLVYENLYAGVFNFDAGKFFEDAQVLRRYAQNDLSGYIKILFGFQNDQPGSPEFDHCLKNTLNWDNGEAQDFFYNDNRIVIRLHSLLDFIAFNSFFVHGLFSCFLSFIGIVFLVRTFQSFFQGKEKGVALILTLLPALWFYTGAPLKEGLGLFILGCSFYHLKQVVEKTSSGKSLIVLIFLLWMSCLLKPYVLIPAQCSWLLFLLVQKVRPSMQVLIFAGISAIVILGINIICKQVLGTSILSAATEHQRQFLSVSHGGYFLRDSTHFLRVPDDKNNLIALNGDSTKFRLSPGISYTYWELSHVKDTLYINDNRDTQTVYTLVYHIPHSGSNIKPGLIGDKQVPVLVSAFYYALFHPLFFSVRNSLQLVASMENLLLIFSLLMIIYGVIKTTRPSLFPFFLVLTALFICLLISFAAPNSGAIFRYRCLVTPFIYMAALYYLPEKFNFKSIKDARKPAI